MVSQETALQAGEAVQQHVLARTARRRLRLFLRKRDQLWENSEDTAAARLLVPDKNEQDSVSGLVFPHVVDLLVEQGLTANDVCSILTHTPSVALMRPRHGENTLESTCHQVLQHVLCDSLQLRRYDARKVRTPTVINCFFLCAQIYCT